MKTVRTESYSRQFFKRPVTSIGRSRGTFRHIHPKAVTRNPARTQMSPRQARRITPQQYGMHSHSRYIAVAASRCKSATQEFGICHYLPGEGITLDGRAAGCKPSKRTASPNFSQIGRKCDAGEKPPSRQLIPAMRLKLALATGGRRRVASERRVRRLQTREPGWNPTDRLDGRVEFFRSCTATCVGRTITAAQWFGLHHMSVA